MNLVSIRVFVVLGEWGEVMYWGDRKETPGDTADSTKETPGNGLW